MATESRNTSPSKSLSTLFITLLFLGGLIALALSNRIIAASEKSTTKIDANHYVSTQVIELDSYYTIEKNYVGNIKAKKSSQLSFQNMGIIEHIFVNTGDTINKGQLLAQLNIDDLQAKKTEINAKLDLAKIKYQLANKNYIRVSTAKTKKAYSEQQVDNALSELKISEAEVAIAQAQIKQLNISIEKASITAPFDGVVTNRFLDEGSTVSPNHVVIAVQNNHYEAICGVSSATATQLNKGNIYKLRISDELIAAQLIAINHRKKNNELIELTFSIAEEDASLLQDGELALFSIAEKIQQSGFWINIESLNEASRGLWSIFIAEKDQESGNYIASPRAIEIIYTNGTQAYITGSFQEGEQVITKGSKKLVPQQKIKITK